MNRPLLASLLVCAAGVFLAAPAAGQTDPVREVHQLLDRIEECWVRRDIRAYAEDCLDPDVLAIFCPVSGLQEGARVLDREKVLKQIGTIWERGALRSHRFVGRDISVQEDIAWLETTISDRAPGRRYLASRATNLALRRDGVWRMCFSMPRFVRTAVLVTEVQPGSQAHGLGVRPGDVVHAYAGGPVPDSATLAEWIESRAGDDDRPTFPLVVIRDTKYLRFDATPGALGMRFEDRLLPTGGAVVVGRDQGHPIKKIMRTQFDAFKAKNIEGYCDYLCPRGFLALAQRESQPPLIIARSNAREMLADAVQQYDEQMELASLQIKDVRLIVAGDVALASSRMVGVKRGPEAGTTDYASQLEVYVRQNERWWLAAILPKRIEIGLHARSPYHRSARETAETERRIRGKFTGVGLGIKLVDEGLGIHQVIPGGGADRAGLETGDIITAIDGQPIAGMTAIQNAVDLLLGEEGTTVELEVRSGQGQARTVTVTRQTIVISNVRSEMLPGKVGLMEVTSFNEQTVERARRELDQLAAAGAVGLILDFRNNTGGVYGEIVRFADLLVGPRRTLWFKRPLNGKPEPVKSKTKAVVDLPLVVLIDSGTAGGELVAAAVKRAKRGTLVGRKTSGLSAIKAMVKQADGSSDLVVREHLFITRRKPITGRGVQPDVTVPTDAKPEQVLDQALSVLKSKIDSRPDR